MGIFGQKTNCLYFRFQLHDESSFYEFCIGKDSQELLENFTNYVFNSGKQFVEIPYCDNPGKILQGSGGRMKATNVIAINVSHISTYKFITRVVEWGGLFS